MPVFFMEQYQPASEAFMQHLPAGQRKTKPQNVMIYTREGGHDVPALTLIPGNPDFPISDLNQLGRIMMSAINGQPVPPHSDVGNSLIHFAQSENGEKLDNGYKLRYRTPNSGVTAEEGVFIAVNKDLPPKLQAFIHEGFAKTIRATLNAYHSVTAHPSADAPRPQHP